MTRWRRAQQTTLPGIVARAFRTAIATALALVVLTVGAFTWIITSALPRLDQLRAANSQAARATSDMLDMETGLRGYLATGDQRFLAPYIAAEKDLPVAVDQLDRITTLGDQQLTKDVIAVEVTRSAWLNGWAAQAAPPAGAAYLPAAGRHDATVTFFAAGKQLFDAYRAARERRDARIDILAGGARSRVSGMILTTVAGDCVIAALLAVALVRRRRALRLLVVGPAADVVETLKAVQAGDFDARASVAGTDELRELAEGLNELAASLQQSHDRAERRAAESTAYAARLRAVLSIAREISGTLNLRYVLEAVSGGVTEMSRAAQVVIWLTSADERSLELAYDSRDTQKTETGEITLELGEQLAGRAAKYGRVTASAGRERVADDEDLLSATAIPMVVGARVVGVIECRSESDLPLGEDVVKVLETLAVHAASSIQAARLHGKAEQLALIDPLTSLANRRRLDEDITAECQRALRYGRPLAFIMADLDRFKAINDEHGHQRADEILQDVASIFADTVRATDTVYRYGGEEIAVLVRESTPEQAAGLAERLRARVESRYRNVLGTPITVSLGVAAIPDDAASPSALVMAADQALYAAKRGGRNRVAKSGSLTEPITG